MFLEFSKVVSQRAGVFSKSTNRYDDGIIVSAQAGNTCGEKIRKITENLFCREFHGDFKKTSLISMRHREHG